MVNAIAQFGNRSSRHDRRPDWTGAVDRDDGQREVLERDPLYDAVADLEVDTSTATPTDAAEAILRAATIRQ